MKKILVLISLLFVAIAVMGATIGYGDTIKNYLEKQGDGLFAVIQINKQILFAELYYEKTPLTVTNFVGLATGKFSTHITNPITRQGNFYDGLSIHRVVENFVIQGGDPDGTGAGGPGYKFPDEFPAGSMESLRHNTAGILSMANAGPNTNGSQFFITLAPAPHLDGRHSVFGKVVENAEHITTISQGDIINSVKIIAEGDEATQFLDTVTWDDFQKLIALTKEKKTKALYENKDTLLSSLENAKNLIKTKDGIFYEILKEGTGEKIKNGMKVEIHYTLTIYGESQILDSSYERGETLSLVVGNNTVIKGWELILLELKQDNKARVVIPPELGYGSSGAGNIIPPEAFLEFTMEIIDVNL